MISTIFIYGFLLFSQPGMNKEIGNFELDSMGMNLAVMAVVMAVLSFVVPKFLKRNMVSKPGGQSPRQAQFVAGVVSWALSESVAIYGFIIANSSKNFGLFVPFAAGALALLFVHRPKQG